MVFGTLIALGVLVTFHELGHFWVARRCGVKVLRFSVGFGKPIFRWHDKQQTEFVVAMIPLGGYVKMLDEREGNVPTVLAEKAFNNKSVQKRIAIVAAGPIANFILAFVFFWFVAMLGTQQVKPIIGEITEPSLAASAGLKVDQEIIEVNGKAMKGWGDISLSLLKNIGEYKDIEITTRDAQGNNLQKHTVALNGWLKGSTEPDPLPEFGIRPWVPKHDTTLAVVQEGAPAAVSGLQKGDKLLSLNGNAISHWQALVAQIQKMPEQQVIFVVERDGRNIQLPVTLARNEKGQGFLGAAPEAVAWPDDMKRDVRFGPIAGLSEAASKTWETTVLTIVSMKKMIFGELSLKNLSGPITIAKVAGSTAEMGLVSFLSFLAFLSISLGVLNLLPIPMLDGGHLLFYVIEWVRGRPVSEKIQMWGMQIGVTLVLAVMALAIFNDISRL